MSRLLLCSLVLGIAVSIGSSPGATSAEPPPPRDVDGAADFRTAPRLTDGTHHDSGVTGESVWYRVLYTNETNYEFRVEPDEELPEGVAMSLEFVAPDLETLETGDELLDGTATFSSATTNSWYLKVNLLTDSEVGKEVRFRLEVAGTNDGRSEPCDELDDCTASKELERATADLKDIDAELAAAATSGGVETVEAAIREAETTADDLKRRLVPRSETPVTVVVVLALVGVLSLVIAAFAGKRSRSDPHRGVEA